MKFKTLEELYDSQLEDEQVYEITAYVNDVFRMENGFTIVTVWNGSLSFKMSFFGKNQFSELQKGTVALFRFTKYIYNDALQGKIKQVIIADDVTKKIVEDEIQTNLSQKNKPVHTQVACPAQEMKKLETPLREAATLIRKALFEHRPILVTHHADCDGFSAAFQVETAIKKVLRSIHKDERALFDYYQRTPSRTPYYHVIDATKDISQFLSRQERFNLKSPLILILDNGSTSEDLLAIKKTKLFGASHVVVDHHDPGQLDEQGKSLICKEVDYHVNPFLVGLDSNVSASLLAYELARFISDDAQEHPFLAAVGAVADKSQSPITNWFISQSTHDREYLEDVALFVDYEIFQTKFMTSRSALETLLIGTIQEREDIIGLYRPLLEDQTKKVNLALQHFTQQKKWGKFDVFVVNGEEVAQRGDYFSIGKLAALVSKQHDDKKPRLVIVHSTEITVFRCDQDEEIFSIHHLLPVLHKKLPFARITGGGHAVAGSLRYVFGAREDFLGVVEDFVSSL